MSPVEQLRMSVYLVTLGVIKKVFFYPELYRFLVEHLFYKVFVRFNLCVLPQRRP